MGSYRPALPVSRWNSQPFSEGQNGGETVAALNAVLLTTDQTVEGAKTFTSAVTSSGDRTAVLDGINGLVTVKGSAGGWGVGLQVQDSGGTAECLIGGYGVGTAFEYGFCGQSETLTQWRAYPSGSVALGKASPATTATDGFAYLPAVAGAPTGTPTTISGWAPTEIDTTNHTFRWFSGGQWRSAGGPVRNIKDFYTGSAITDQQAYNAAVASLPATGGVIYFPTGSYTVSPQLADGVTLRGDGMLATVITGDVTFATGLDSGLAYHPAYSGLENLCLIGEITRTNALLPYWFRLSHCQFRDSPTTYGINCTTNNPDQVGQHWLVEHCHFRGSAININLNTVTFNRCRFGWNATNFAVVLQGPPDGMGKGSFLGCTFEGNNRGGLYLGHNVIATEVKGCYFEGNNQENLGYGDIYIEAPSRTNHLSVVKSASLFGGHEFENNWFAPSSTAVYAMAISAGAFTQRITIRDMHLTGAFRTAGPAINVDTYTGLIVDGLKWWGTPGTSYDNASNVNSTPLIRGGNTLYGTQTFDGSAAFSDAATFSGFTTRLREGTGSGNGESWSIDVQNQAASDGLSIGYTSSAYTTGGAVGWLGNSMGFCYYPTELRFGTGLGSAYTLRMDSSGGVGVVNLDAGLSGTAGTVDIFPSTASKGKLSFVAADSAGNTTTTITNASQAAARTYTIPDVGASGSFDLHQFNVRAYGAKGDGSTDDTAAFNAVIAAVNATTGYVTIYIPDGQYPLLSGTNAITKPGVTWVGQSREGSVILADAGNVFHWNTSGDVRGGVKNLYILYGDSVPHSTAVMFKAENTHSLNFENITYQYARTVLAAGVDGSSTTSMSLNNVCGSIYNGGSPCIHIGNGAGLFISNCAMSVAGIPTPVDPDPMTTAANTNWLQFHASYSWDTVQVSNCILERFYIGVSSLPGNGVAHVNLKCSNTYFDYIRASAVYLAPASGGNVAGFEFTNAWLCSWDGDAVYIAGAGSTSSTSFVQCTIPIAGEHGININSATVYNTRIIGGHIVSVGRNGANRYGIVLGAGYGTMIRDTIAGYASAQFAWQATYGVAVAADLEYTLEGCDLSGSSGGFLNTTNTVANSRRLVINNPGAGYSGQKSGAGYDNPPATDTTWTNLGPWTLDVIISGGTITDIKKNGVTVAAAGPITLTLAPSETYRITHSVNPTVTYWARA